MGDEAALLDELAALYREVDDRYADVRCDRTTECCRFGITGREPQVTSIEAAALRVALARRGGALRPDKRALPLAGRGRDERACPLLDRSGRCAIYAARPLGCRTYHCARADIPDPPSRHELRDYVRRLQTIASQHRVDGDRPNALTAALR